MAKIVKMEKVSLKNNPAVKEDLIQSFIFEDPSVLGLGDLSPIQREKNLPTGGRLDILLAQDMKLKFNLGLQTQAILFAPLNIGIVKERGTHSMTIAQ